MIHLHSSPTGRVLFSHSTGPPVTTGGDEFQEEVRSWDSLDRSPTSGFRVAQGSLSFVRRSSFRFPRRKGGAPPHLRRPRSTSWSWKVPPERSVCPVLYALSVPITSLASRLTKGTKVRVWFSKIRKFFRE